MSTSRALATITAALGVVIALGAPVAGAVRTVSVPARASLVLTGAARGDLAGASVAPAGDVNGDGRADVIVGAPLADPGGRSDTGAAYVVFGGRRGGRLSLGALAGRGFRIGGAIASDRSFHPGAGPLTSGAGAVVAGAGDVNGDGLDDVVVTGRIAAPPLVSAPHAVFVVFGKRDSLPVDLGALGSGGFAMRADDAFVTAIAGHPAGDVNGDGRADVAVELGVDGDEFAGAVAVVFGKADSAPVDLGADRFDAPTWGLRLVGRDSGLMLGSAAGAGAAVAPAGDVNRDGLGDLLVGAPGAVRGRAYGSGSVFVVYGRRIPGQIGIGVRSPFSGFAVRSPRARVGFGASVARLGGGFVAGAPGAPFARRTGAGAVFVVRARGARPIRLAGPTSGGPVGLNVAAPGDVDRDGLGDVLAVPHGRRGGLVSALLFSRTGRRIASYTGLRNGAEARSTAAAAGDTDGDGRPDLILGSPGANAAYLVTAP